MQPGISKDNPQIQSWTPRNHHALSTVVPNTAPNGQCCLQLAVDLRAESHSRSITTNFEFYPHTTARCRTFLAAGRSASIQQPPDTDPFRSTGTSTAARFCEGLHRPVCAQWSLALVP